MPGALSSQPVVSADGLRPFPAFAPFAFYGSFFGLATAHVSRWGSAGVPCDSGAAVAALEDRRAGAPSGWCVCVCLDFQTS